ncbi:hypothetical protein CIPAW_05G006800 [Carya illinoinensis]|uniref:Uncharacterized protein n=1 Tax=Carya illinoinensis TaxID=32201 RepID=A0A8T1QDW3_CARIL|nr:hypothetical protein CIPAW_05G006800 [Carya illinoinensis]
MSSLSVHFLSPPLSSPTLAWRKTRHAATPAVAPVMEELDLARLETKVEEREGYWVLKEKFREGINPQEKVELEKEPMKLFMEGEIEKLAKMSLEEIDKAKVTKDDIDVRLKWLGRFHRRKHQYGRFMMRLKLPNGVTTSAQRYLASVIRKYGKDGCADVTTGKIGKYLGSPAEWNGQCEKSCWKPLAGIELHEMVDTQPYASLLSQFITANSCGNPAITNFKPRKWNHPHINGLAYMPALNDAKFGFNLLVGGFFSTKRCAEAVPLDDLIFVCKAMLEAYRDLGNRGNKTRMMWLIDEIGIEGFSSEVVKRMPRQELERASPEDIIQKAIGKERVSWCPSTKARRFSYAGLHIPVGRVQADDMNELARLVDTYGSGELQLIVEQNIIIPNIENSKLKAFSPGPPPLMKGLVACTGNQLCGQAIIETKARALKVTEEVERQMAMTRLVMMHWTMADIGVMGCMARDEKGKPCEGVDVYLGGRIGSYTHLGDLYKKGVPCKDLVPLVVDNLD